MTFRSVAKLCSLLAPLFLSGAALAQTPGVTSGPEAESGQNVQPSTAIEKQVPGSPGAPPTGEGGGPGVEGKPGAESGPAQTPPPGQPPS